MTAPTVWLVAGNKGGVGKSVFSKALAELFIYSVGLVTIVDGDVEGDVADAYGDEFSPVWRFDMAVPEGWADFIDWIISAEFDDGDNHVVVNLPDSVTERTLESLARYRPIATEAGIKTYAFFVINTLPDGLRMLGSLFQVIDGVYPVLNLNFGKATDFKEFNRRFAKHFESQTIYFPRMQPTAMNVIRSTRMGFMAAAKQRAYPGQTLLQRIELSNWLGYAMDSIAEVGIT